ncbi:MAG: DUF255 domain-containing protein [Chlorobi bacterium]|nr:DUF255 domain-containing protein [Chlorobiota bacterium]
MTKFLIIITLFFVSFSTIKGQEKVKWFTFEQAVEKNKTNPRKIMIDVYTDWCGWCKVMDRNTFSNPVIAEYLNKNYYPVKFNAEGHDTITFQNHKFVNEGNGKRSTHQLAIALLQGKLSYPSVVYMDESNQLITAVPGYWEPKKMEPLLEFIKKSLYKTELSFDEYSKNYKGKVQ